MLSFKNNPNAPPLYDYYVETDLDSSDDQPVDYSKKYSEQDSYIDCRRTKSILKTNELPPEVSQTVKQTCNDEVKVYCIEGTPLTISYASSLSDLREIGSSCPVEKSNFPSINDDDCTDSFDVDIKKDMESPPPKDGDSSLTKEKEDVKEAKSVSFRNSTDISKASSPLMFSRTSSVGSLNSFEQQSIIDDRSSVSVFSALTSGLISPSDLPDSPGELMSPALTDKESSPKIDVTKNDECENIDLEEKNTVDTEEILIKDIDNHVAAKVQQLQIKASIPADIIEEKKVPNNELEISNDSIENDEVFVNSDYKNNSFSVQKENVSEHLSTKSDDESDDDDILLQQCIQLGMPSDPKENKCGKKLEYLPHSPNAAVTQAAIDDEILLSDKTTTFNPAENPSTHNREIELPKEDPVTNISASLEILDVKPTGALKSEDESDEDDELLQRCIELGMPESATGKTVPATVGLVKSICSTHSSSHESEQAIGTEECEKSDEDLDADDDILQKCIQLGMPEKVENQVPKHLHKPVEFPVIPADPNTCQIQPKTKNKPHQPQHGSRGNMMPLPCMQYRSPHKPPEANTINTKPVGTRMPSPVKKVSKNVPQKPYPIKAEMDSDGDESDALLQHCVQMGMPKEPSDRKVMHPGVFRKPEFDKSLFIFHPVNDMRDNCPDGVSDGEEDDDAILEKCIRAGMPSPKITNVIQNRLHNAPAKQTTQKQQIVNRPFIQEATPTETCKKSYSVRLPPNQPYAPVHSGTMWISNTSVMDVDSMRIYRTEDTPILSPSASISDLSSLSFNESFLNNSRNSDCSSDSDDEDDELLRRCIRSGMPLAKRAVA